MPQNYVNVYQKTYKITILHTERMKHQQDERNQLLSTLSELLENQENGSTIQSIESKAKKRETVKLDDFWLERSEKHTYSNFALFPLFVVVYVWMKQEWGIYTDEVKNTKLLI